MLCSCPESRYIRPIQACNFSSKKTESSEGPDEPVSYLNSNAAKWSARHSRTLGTDERLPYQPHVIIFSLVSLLVYFCILREENDIDKLLSQNLDNKIPGLEEQHMKLIQQYNLEKKAQ